MDFTINDHEIAVEARPTGANWTLEPIHVVTVRPYNATGSSLLTALTGQPERSQKTVLQQGVYAAEAVADLGHVALLARYCRGILGPGPATE